MKTPKFEIKSIHAGNDKRRKILHYTLTYKNESCHLPDVAHQLIIDLTDFAKKENAELINILGECLSYIPTGISYKGGYLKGIVKDIVNQKFKDDEKGNIEST
jgi:hypothetical protein